MDSESEYSVKSTTWSIEDAMNKIKRRRVSVKNVSGVFVSDKSLNKLDAVVKRMLNRDGAGPSLVKIQESLATLQAENAQAKESLNAAKARERAMSTSLAEAKSALADMQVKATTRHRELNEEKAKLKVALDRIAEEKNAIDPLAAKYDADIAIEQKKIIDGLNVEKKRVLSLVEALSNEKNSLNVQVRTLMANVQSLSVEKANISKDVGEGYKAMNEASCPPSPSIPVSISSPAVKRMLGQRGLEWLQKLDDISRENLRERAFTMMQASTNSKNQFWKSLNVLLNMVWKWIKTASKKAAAKIKPWLDLVETDLRKGVHKTVKFYREELEKLKIDFQAEKSSMSDRRVPPQKADLTWMDHAYAWFTAIKNAAFVDRPHRRSWFSSFRAGVNRFASPLFSFFSPRNKGWKRPSTPESVYDDFLPESPPEIKISMVDTEAVPDE